MNRIARILMVPVVVPALLLAGCGQEQEADEAGETTAAPAEAPSADAGNGEKAPAETAEPEISVHFVSPEDGAQVTSPFKVEMAAEGVDVVPAGEVEEGTGHMHILVDAPFVMPGEVIPSDEQHLHYGDGSTTATLDLEAGDHVLRLQFADGAHKALEGNEYRDVIQVDVQGEASADAGPAREEGDSGQESDAGAEQEKSGGQV